MVGLARIRGGRICHAHTLAFAYFSSFTHIYALRHPPPHNQHHPDSRERAQRLRRCLLPIPYLPQPLPRPRLRLVVQTPTPGATPTRSDVATGGSSGVCGGLALLLPLVILGRGRALRKHPSLLLGTKCVTSDKKLGTFLICRKLQGDGRINSLPD